MGARQTAETRPADSLYDLFGAQVYRFCYRLCGDATDAEDLMQDVFVMALRDLPQYQGRAALCAWLYGIALHRWQNVKRSRRPTVPFDEEIDTALASRDTTSGPIERMALEQALATLPDSHRRAFVLVKLRGFKHWEAAEMMRVPQGTVQFWVREASLRLRAILVP